jgi:hypothetical protein
VTSITWPRAAGVNSSRDEVVAYNGWFDLVSYWRPIEKKKHRAESPNPAVEACSYFIATGFMTAEPCIEEFVIVK